MYYLRDKNGRQFTDLFEVHIIELGKELDGSSPVDDWIRFFNANTEEELDMIHTTNAGINLAIGEVKRMSMSERMRARYEAHMKEVRDRNAREAYVKEVARKEGRAELIAHMLNNGKTPEEIADFCHCDMQEIEAVQDAVATGHFRC